MNGSLNHLMVREVPRRLAELLALPVKDVHALSPPTGVDTLILAGGFKFYVVWKSSGNAAVAVMAARQIRQFAEESRKKFIPLFVTPFIGAAGRKMCEELGVAWLDLSGNAHIVAPGLRVIIEGKPNQFKQPGRPRSLFAPKSSRISRLLLIHPGQSFTQRQLTKDTGLDEGFTSRVVRQLEAQKLIQRDANGAVKVADFNVLLDAWRETYDFSRHTIVRGHVAARSGDEVLQRVAVQLKRSRIQYAATGLSGAWLLNPFAGFRLVTIYVAQMPSIEIQQSMGFREERQGENAWLVIPNDQGVFQGAVESQGISCAHPVQVYLDLKGHPERATEAAEQLRKKLLNKESHA